MPFISLVILSLLTTTITTTRGCGSTLHAELMGTGIVLR